MTLTKEDRLKVLSQKLTDPDNAEFPGLSADEAVEYLTLQGTSNTQAELLLKIAREGWRDDEVIEV